MPFEVQPITDAEFPRIIALEWESFQNPLQRIYRIYAPILNNDPESSFRQTLKRNIDSYMEQRDESWFIKAVDTDNENEIAGVAGWVFGKKKERKNELNSSDEKSKEKEEEEEEKEKEKEKDLAWWFPEGGQRIFANAVLEQVYGATRGKKPEVHASLNTFFTVPEYRRRGIGSLLMKRSVEKADELGLEGWIDATVDGARTYEKYGYSTIEKLIIQPKKPCSLSKKERTEWEEIESVVSPVEMLVMWRPAGGEIC